MFFLQKVATVDGKLKNQFDNTTVSSYLYHREVNQFPSKIEMSQV